MKYLLISLALFIGAIVSVSAQQNGIKGVVLDVETMKTIEGVSIQLIERNSQTSSDAQGNFFFEVPKGNKSYKIVASVIGYDSDTIIVDRGNDDVVFATISLVSKNSVLDEIVVSRRRERASEIALLDMRKQSNLMVELMGAQELSRKGISDAGAAVNRMTGVSRQEGSNEVFVRGLGDRYNNTTLNGLPVPSNDPELKNLELGLFTSDIIEYITIDKVYSTYLPGDFAGGNVDIASKNYEGKGFFEVKLGSSVNTNVLNNWNNFYLQDGPSPLGFANYGVPNDPLGGFNFQNSMNPVKKTPWNGNFGLLGGKSFDFSNGHKLNLFASANFSSDTYHREGVNRQLSAGGGVINDLSQVRQGFTTNSTGMLTANYALNQNHKITYNFLLMNSSDQFYDTYTGHLTDMAENNNGLIRRSTFMQNTVITNQFLGKHKLNDKIDINWGASYNAVKTKIPDRIQNYMSYNDTLQSYVFIRNTSTDNHRYFQDLTENEVAINLAANYKLNNDKGLWSVGYSGKIKERSFEDFQVNFVVPRDRPIDPKNLDEFFNKTNLNNEDFSQEGFNADLPQTYDGKQTIHAPFTNVQYNLTDKLSSVLGLRYENISQDISFRTQLDRSGRNNNITRNEFLPSLLLKYVLKEKQNLRMGVSRTYTLPQFKERAFFNYRDVNESKQGNPNLYPSTDYNFDLRWEAFPKSSELLSATLFGKYIQNPINEVQLTSSSNDISYVNIGDYGTVFGIEVEFKKDMIESEGFGKLSAGANAAYMNTDQVIDPEKVRRETQFASGGQYNINTTDKRSKFTGASDFLINADVSYYKSFENSSDILATVVYNYFSDRLYAFGNEGRGNQIDQGVGTLDFILKYKINNRLGIDANILNVTNPNFNRIQENKSSEGEVLAPSTLFNYKRGVRFSIGVRYRL
ncbi:TonB-dependent receptor domain-containing protein [Sphingobacterium corticis]|uniref:TonB-dependent receptor domain-containing protein n=1 Tax=Sphingobacterium corticis TaxID=1812823 RepID=A0ABW5NN73_9SPHI